MRLSSKFAIGFDYAGCRLRAEAAAHLVVEAQLWDMPLQALALPYLNTSNTNHFGLYMA